jgi:hypothetical protein
MFKSISPLRQSQKKLMATHDLLSTGELVSRSPESLENDGLVALLASDGQDDLTATWRDTTNYQPTVSSPFSFKTPRPLRTC